MSILDHSRLSGDLRLALVQARAVAESRAHVCIDGAHVWYALADDGCLGRLLARCQISTARWRDSLDRSWQQHPPTGSAGLSPVLTDVLATATDEEAFLRATVQDPVVAQALALVELPPKAVLALLSSAEPHGAAELGRDLLAAAHAGEIDRVIGRDEDIDRLIRVLLRRKKNNPVLIGEPGVGKTALVDGLALRLVAGAVPPALRSYQLHALEAVDLVAGTGTRGSFEARLRDLIAKAESQPLIIFIDEIHSLLAAGHAHGGLAASEILKPALTGGRLLLIGATTAREYRQHLLGDGALERRLQPLPVHEPGLALVHRIVTALRPRYEQHHGVVISDALVDELVQLCARYIHDRQFPDKALDVLDDSCALAAVMASDASARSQVLAAVDAYRHAGADDAGETAALQDFDRAMARLGLEPAGAAPVDAHRLVELQSRLQRVEASAAACQQTAPEQYAFLTCIVAPSLREECQHVQALLEHQRVQVHAEHLHRIIAERSGLPLSRLGLADTDQLNAVAAHLAERCCGLEAVQTEMLRFVRAHVQAPETVRSIGLLGPANRARRFLLQSLGEALGRTLVQIDLAAFAEDHSLSRLVGAPPGYVGHGEEGLLVRALANDPFSLILFANYEQAAGPVRALVDKMIEDAELVDGRDGRSRPCEHAIIACTALSAAWPQGVWAISLVESSNEHDHAVLHAWQQRCQPEKVAPARELGIDAPCHVRCYLRALAESASGPVSAFSSSSSFSAWSSSP